MDKYYLLGGIILIIIIIAILIYYRKRDGPSLNNTNEIITRDTVTKHTTMKDIVTKHTYYINLKHRTDRKRDTLRELQSFGIHNPTRFDAIKDDFGAIGCSKSHLEVLKIARKNNYPYVTIIEDDVQFLNPKKTIQSLNNILNSKIPWDVILIGGNNSPPYKQINENCIKVENCQTTTGYIVKKSYYNTLINHWEKGLNLLIKTRDTPKYALDMYWKILQKRDNFLLIYPLHVTQREGFSDIENYVVDYNDVMVDLK